MHVRFLIPHPYLDQDARVGEAAVLGERHLPCNMRLGGPHAVVVSRLARGEAHLLHVLRPRLLLLLLLLLGGLNERLVAARRGSRATLRLWLRRCLPCGYLCYLCTGPAARGPSTPMSRKGRRDCRTRVPKKNNMNERVQALQKDIRKAKKSGKATAPAAPAASTLTPTAAAFLSQMRADVANELGGGTGGSKPSSSSAAAAADETT